MPKMIRSVLIGASITSKDDTKMVYLAASDRALSDMKKDVFASDKVFSQYVFHMQQDGMKKQRHICFCYMPASQDDAPPPNKVANAIFDVIFDGGFCGPAFHGPVLVFSMHEERGIPWLDLDVGEDFDTIIEQLHEIVKTQSTPQHGVWGHDLRPVMACA